VLHQLAVKSVGNAAAESLIEDSVSKRTRQESPTDMDALLDSLGQILTGFWGLAKFLLAAVVPWLGLVAWIVFWLFAVNWRRLHKVLWDGGFIGLALTGLVMMLVWGSIAPPESGSHYLLGLTVSNYVGKFVYVAALFCIMFLCGAVQMAGVFGDRHRWELAEAEPAAELHAHHDSHGQHDVHAAHH
jgi:hypothetical protein